MALRNRFTVMLAVLVLLVSVSGLAVAQTDGPDPDSPIQLPTADTNDGDQPAETPTVPPSPTSTPTSAPTDSKASPVAAPGEFDLAAMTLDSSAIPEEFILIGEAYAPLEGLADSFIGLINHEELLATGIAGFYQSTYINAASGDTLRTYVVAYDTVEGVQGGFDLLEDEEMLVPNGALSDLPALAGVGEAPAEITTGFIENGDGTRTGSYDVTFRIDRIQAGAAMETRDGSDPDSEIVDAMARALADRVAEVLAGNEVSGVVYGLPDALIRFEILPAYEGYQSADETILSDAPGELRDGYLSGYYRAASFSTSPISVVPYITIGVNQFATGADVAEAIAAPEAMMPAFDDLGELTEVTVDGADPLAIEGADAVIALSFSSPQGEADKDSVRLFIQADDRLISIDVQGMASTTEALDVAVRLAELQVDCTIEGVCDVAGGIEP